MIERQTTAGNAKVVESDVAWRIELEGAALGFKPGDT